jgi:hypothetical protein
VTDRFLLASNSSCKMYSGDSQYKKGRLKSNEKFKEKNFSPRRTAYSVVRTVDCTPFIR